MVKATRVVQPEEGGQEAPPDYDAFLSYTHSDRPVVSGIQKGLHQIGRRLGQLRALRVFRDDTDLTASPDLWGRITEALDRSRFLIATLSPRAAQSHWVNEEIGYWIGHRGLDQLMLVVAAGQLHWDERTARFDPQTSDAAPPVLTEPGSLPTEPLFIDVSDDAPWDHRSPVFRDQITALAAPIHGKPKDQLASDDLREQRRYRRLRAAAITGLVLLTVLAVAAAVIAVVQRQQAIRSLHDAVVAKLNAEGAAMLAGTEPGGDIRALQELLAANAIEANGVPVLSAQIARFTTQKVVDTFSKVSGVAYSPDGTRIATAQFDGTALQWNSASGKPAVGTALRERTGPMHDVVYTPDGRTIAAAGGDGGMRLINADTSALLNPNFAHVGPLNCITMSSDGKAVVTGGLDGSVRSWDGRTGRLLATDNHSPQQVSDVKFDRSGNLLAVGRVDGSVSIYDAKTRQLHAPTMWVKDRDGEPAAVWRLAFSPDGHTIALGATDLQLWDVDTGASIRAIRVGAARMYTVNAVAFSPDGDRVVTGRNDGAVQLWETESGEQLGQTMTGHTGEVFGAAFRPDGRQIATVSLDGTLRLWSAIVGQTMHGPGGEVAFSPDGRRFAAASDYTVAQWDTASGQSLVSFIPIGIGMVHFRFVEGGRIVTATDDGTVQLWDANTGQPASPPVHLDITQGAARFAFSSDGRMVATGDTHSGTTQLWDVTIGRALGRAMEDKDIGGVDCLSFSPDGHLLAVGGNGLRLWNTSTTHPEGPAMVSGHSVAVVTSMAFSRDGRVLAAGMGDASVELWDPASRKTLPASPLTGHTSQVRAVAFGPGTQLASGAVDGTLRLWDASTGSPVAAPLPSTDILYSVALSPDGRLAAAGRIDGVGAAVVLSPARADPAQLCDKLVTNMSHKQWREWVSPALAYQKLCPNLPVAPD